MTNVWRRDLPVDCEDRAKRRRGEERIAAWRSRRATTNSATRPKAHSRVRSGGGGGASAGREEAEEETDPFLVIPPLPPHRSFLALPPSAIERGTRGNPLFCVWLKPGASGGASARPDKNYCINRRNVNNRITYFSVEPSGGLLIERSLSIANAYHPRQHPTYNPFVPIRRMKYFHVRKKRKKKRRDHAPRFSLRIDSGIVGAYATAAAAAAAAAAARAAVAAAVEEEEEDEEEEEEEEEGPCQPACRPNRASSIGERSGSLFWLDRSRRDSE
ncbi:hypothetical protein ALC56_01271 [Trachymyrmex septentrionalis]|uniref:Uncharacterized protein n=1 Tax=Trachymyrmex septentrionalis TaxID=34720 RepID=A0A195FUI6_9HYME|nr:hypothetical protein ALC56_01271 [Trachymyrmex septentrionalis]